MIRRLWNGLREHGVVDGAWTFAASVGSKVQTLFGFALAGQLAGLDGVGQVVLSISLGALVSSVTDLGVSTQATRVAASGSLSGRSPLLWPIAARAASSAVIALGVGWAIFSSTYPSYAPFWFAVATALYAACFSSSMIATQAAYGFGRFRGGATLNGTVRTLTVPVLAAVGAIGLPVWALVVVLAAGELVIAALQFRALPSPTIPTARGLLSPRETWPYATGPVANALMNRSDTVVVAAVSSAAVVGVYGIASQVQNALTTLALVPAGAAVAYAAKSRGSSSLSRQALVLSVVVGLGYLVVSTPVFFLPTQTTELVFGVEIADPATLRICLVAGVFSCIGGIAMQLLSGVGDRRGVATIWVVTAIVAVAMLAIGSITFGAVGAAIAALVRDLIFFTLSWARLASRHMREHD